MMPLEQLLVIKSMQALQAEDQGWPGDTRKREKGAWQIAQLRLNNKEGL